MRILLALVFLFIFMPSAIAAEKHEALPEIKTIEAYLNGISTLKSRFAQTSGDGTRITGNFMLKRPGKLRFEYDPPVSDFIVADGVFIYYYDGQMKQQSFTPISRSLADFFLRKNLKLSGDISISDIKRADGLLQVTLTQTKEPLAGLLTLMFGEKPLQLKKWRIIDAQGLTTEIELYEMHLGEPLDNSLFHYYDPALKEPILNK